MGETRTVYTIFAGNLLGNMRLEDRNKGETNIKEIEFWDMEWMELA
jgi:hypothetical protein